MEGDATPIGAFAARLPITTARLLVDALHEPDLSALQVLTDDPLITDNVDFLPDRFTRANAAALIGRPSAAGEQFVGVWRRDRPALIGVVGVHLRGSGEIEIGYWLGSAHHGHGFATEAAGAIIRTLRLAFPTYAIVAECRPDNGASWRVLEKLGFRPHGRNGQRPGRKLFRLSGTGDA